MVRFRCGLKFGFCTVLLGTLSLFVFADEPPSVEEEKPSSNPVQALQKMQQKIDVLKAQLVSRDKIIAILEGEIEAKDAKIKIQQNLVETKDAQIEKNQQYLSIQESLTEFRETQIKKLQEVVQEQKIQIQKLTALTAGE